MIVTRRRALAAVGVVIAVVLAVVAVWLWRSGIETSTYPPLQVDDTTVGGPYQLTRYSGGRIAGASLIALAALLALAWSVRTVLTARRHP